MTVNFKQSFAIAALAALTGFAAAAPVMASEYGERSVVVAVDQAAATGPASEAALREQLEHAARQACRRQSDRTLSDRADRNACELKAFSEALKQAGMSPAPSAGG